MSIARTRGFAATVEEARRCLTIAAWRCPCAAPRSQRPGLARLLPRGIERGYW